MRASEIIERVRSLYRRDTAQREPVDINALIREMIVLLHELATRNSVAVRTELADGLPAIMADLDRRL